MKSPVHPYSADGQEELERRRAQMRVAVGATCVVALAFFVFQVRSTVITTISPEEYQGLTESNAQGIQDALGELDTSTSATGDALDAVLDQVDAGMKQAEATQAVLDELTDAIEVQTPEEMEQP